MPCWRVSRFRLFALASATGLLLAAAPAYAQRTLTRAAYLDKLHGMWFGQLIANHSGRSVEGHYTTREPAPDSVFAWVIKTTPADPWTGDDDTSFEYLYLHTLETYGLNPTSANIKQEWSDHVVAYYGIFIANLQAKILMGYGFAPPDTGSYRYNFHAYAIDAQITTESLGAMSPVCASGPSTGCRRSAGSATPVSRCTPPSSTRPCTQPPPSKLTLKPSSKRARSASRRLPAPGR
jgi:hypothetical protein